MKFSALNVDFSSLSPDPLNSRRPAQAGVKDSYPLKRWLFYRNAFAHLVSFSQITCICNRNMGILYAGLHVDDNGIKYLSAGFVGKFQDKLLLKGLFFSSMVVLHYLLN